MILAPKPRRSPSRPVRNTPGQVNEIIVPADVKRVAEGELREVLVLPVMAFPRGSEYPNSKVSGPNIHTLKGFWNLKPYYLGTWTLRVPK